MLLQEELKQDPIAQLQHVYRFLGVNPNLPFISDTSKNIPNRGLGVPRRYWVRNMIYHDNWIKRIAKTALPTNLRKLMNRRLIEATQTTKPKLSPQDREEFFRIFKDDIKSTEDELGRDLMAPWGYARLKEDSP